MKFWRSATDLQNLRVAVQAGRAGGSSAWRQIGMSRIVKLTTAERRALNNQRRDELRESIFAELRELVLELQPADGITIDLVALSEHHRTWARCERV